MPGPLVQLHAATGEIDWRTDVPIPARRQELSGDPCDMQTERVHAMLSVNNLVLACPVRRQDHERTLPLPPAGRTGWDHICSRP
jgi:hypothetical protein